jgi:hypothetical protein
MQAPSTVAIGPFPLSTHALMRLMKLDIVGRCFSRQTPALFEPGVDPLLKKNQLIRHCSTLLLHVTFHRAEALVAAELCLNTAA